METEKEYLDSIYKATGLRVGKEFGFIFGRHAPYLRENHMSSSNEDGYIVWKRLIK
jgi:hypothetical protein